MEGRERTWAALLGCPGTKRRTYFEHAARDVGLHVLFIDWKSWSREFWDDWFARYGAKGMLKIDPPRWESARLLEYPALTEQYRECLEDLGRLAEERGFSFLNHPGDIAQLLDKRACKKKLACAGLSVTREVCRASSLEELLAAMEEQNLSQVFIKPNYGSGALGVTAFRVQKRTGKMVLYTCAAWALAENSLVNTKRMQRIEDEESILLYINRLLELDCIIERWYPKEEYRGYSYDLRAVIQDGQMDFLLARLSKGPITNLQLNNHPLPAEELNLPPEVLHAVKILAREAVELYPGLQSAGVDILLEKGSKKPRIIEMNGQGDLLYQDIGRENRIYRHQAELMKAYLGKRMEEEYDGGLPGKA